MQKYAERLSVLTSNETVQAVFELWGDSEEALNEIQKPNFYQSMALLQSSIAKGTAKNCL